MDEDRKKHLLRTFDDIIELMATQGQKVVCSRLQEVRQLLREQPEIVRCKDCKHYKDGFCYNPNTYDDEKTRGNTSPNWFCADGERKGGAELGCE